jgi:membrane protease YdiL (CAAX protease family)
MATIAGIFYGRAFRRTGGLMAPALVHALVDTVWRAVFR